MEESRKQFEEVFEEITGWEVEDYPNEDYVDTLWRIWQASRAAIEIDVGEEPDGERPDYYTGRDEVISSIRDAGLKIKGE